MKYIITITLFVISSTAIASGSYSGGHGHEQSKAEAQGHGGAHHGGGHSQSGGGHAESAVGMPASAEQAIKTINVELLDTMRFKFSEKIDIKDGDIVKFVVTNKGRLPHEFSIGNKKEQDAHREMMRNMPNMRHEDGNAVALKSGETKELTWQFRGKEDVIFACNVPGHYESGMHSMAKIHGGSDHH